MAVERPSHDVGAPWTSTIVLARADGLQPLPLIFQESRQWFGLGYIKKPTWINSIKLFYFQRLTKPDTNMVALI